MVRNYQFREENGRITGRSLPFKEDKQSTVDRNEQFRGEKGGSRAKFSRSRRTKREQWSGMTSLGRNR